MTLGVAEHLEDTRIGPEAHLPACGGDPHGGDPAGGDPGGGDPGGALGLSQYETNFGLSFPGREWTFWFEHQVTGEVACVTSWESRMKRMKKRLKAWGRAAPLNVDYIVVHLTYRPGAYWRPLHITEFIAVVKKHLKKDLLGYTWVAEMQKRGAVHYHVVLAVRPGVRIPKPDLAGWWPYGSTTVEKKRRPLGYLMDYWRKIRQKRGYPRGIRIFAVVWFQWAAGGDSRFLLALWTLPAWLLDRIDQFVAILQRILPRRVGGGEWEWMGRRFRSPWRLMMITPAPI
jgi:hypothetical protein